MKRAIFLSFLAAIILWLAFAGILLGTYHPKWLPNEFLKLTLPDSLSDFGQAFSALEGLVSSMALMLGLLAIVIQVKQSADSNVIGAFSTRQQFLLAESDRLEQQIQSLKSGGGYDTKLLSNMAAKKSRLLEEARAIDEHLKKLLERI